MYLLAIDKDTKLRIKSVIHYAEDNVIDINTLKRLADAFGSGKVVSPIGNNSQRTLSIPIGFMVTFSLEEQPFGLTRHMSVSTHRGAPSIEAVNMLMEEFGFSSTHIREPTTDRYISLNTEAKHPVIDIIELIKEINGVKH